MFSLLWFGQHVQRKRKCCYMPAILQSGVFHSGIFQSGVFQSGVLHVGISQSSVFQSGIFHVGVFQSGVFRSSIFQSGVYQSDIFQSAVYRSGMFPPGIFQPGVGASSRTKTNPQTATTKCTALGNNHFRINKPHPNCTRNNFCFFFIRSNIRVEPITIDCHQRRPIPILNT